MQAKKEIGLAKIEELNLSASVTEKLADKSIINVEQLTALCEREVLSVKGIGAKSLENIKTALNRFGLTLAEDPYESLVCGRHNVRRNDTRIRSYFLCESCAKNFEEQALNNSKPIFKIAIGGGLHYCSHCNEEKELALYQWYVCDVCDRVLKSIGRGLEADRGFIRWWNSARGQVRLPLEMMETDKPRLSPVNGDENDDDFDFKWTYKRSILFGAEIKTGRNHLCGGNVGSGMSQFQLDVSDIEAVLASMEKREPFIPAYVFHTQVVDVPKPPTTRFECVGIWWVSISDLIDNIEQIKRRPRENRPAAYINTDAFEKIESFSEEIGTEGYRTCPEPSALRESLNSKTA